MPSVQVVDFGPDPRAQAMGSFTHNFLNKLYEGGEKRRDENIFEDIKNRQKEGGSIEDLYADVIGAKGLSQSYKENTLKDLKELATLISNKDKTSIRSAENETRKDTNKINAARVANTSKQIDQANKNQKHKLTNEISKYVNTTTKDSKYNPEDKAMFNEMIQFQLDNNPELTIPQAFRQAEEAIIAKNDIVNHSKFVEKQKVGFFGATQQQYEKSYQDAEQTLEKYYDEGITSQTDLRKIAKRGGWDDAEITEMLQNVFRRNGRKARTPKPKEEAKEEETKTEDLDEVLFG